MKTKLLCSLLPLAVLLLSPLLARGAMVDPTGQETGVLLQVQPKVEKDTINYGNMWLTASNYGFFGHENDYNYPGCIFPAFSNQDYLFWGGLWLGAVVEDSILVSCGCEGWAGPHYQFFPGTTEADKIERRSNRTTDPNYHPDAVSELDFIAVYADTYTDPSIVGCLLYTSDAADE